MAERIVIRNGVVFTPRSIVYPGTVAIEEGRITGVHEDRRPGAYPGGAEVIDARGRLVLPGLVDLHNDGLEKEISPRPGVRFPVAWALLNYDRRLAACGITTEFHAVYFADLGEVRKVDYALETVRELERSGDEDLYAVDHRVLYRMEIGCREGALAIASCLDKSRTPYVSFNEHVPGRGQYRKLKTPQEIVFALADALEGELCAGDAGLVEERISGWMEQDGGSLAKSAWAMIKNRHAVYASHDDDTPERVRFFHSLGVTLCEFPVTVEAAMEAKRLGMPVAVGATNVLRGGSLSGNVSAEELICRGLADILCSDYYAPALLGAVFKLYRDGVMDLGKALEMATANPARCLGLDALGLLAEGYKANIIIVNAGDGVPVVEGMLRDGRLRFLTGSLAGGSAGRRDEEVYARGSGEDISL